MESTSGDEKICTSCNRSVQRQGFSERQWRRYNWRRCKECTASTANCADADVELQVLLEEAEGRVVAAALEEVGLMADDRVAFMSVWNERMAAHKSANLNVVMNKIVVSLMETLGEAASKEKKDQYRRVWSIANRTLWGILHPDQKNPRDASQNKADDDDLLDHPWPNDDDILRGFWVTARVGNRTGARDEILAALEPVALTLDLECKSLHGLGKSLLFISLPTKAGAEQATPKLNQMLVDLYADNFKCRFCETITPLQWVGKADEPERVAAGCRALLDSLLGSDLKAAKFSIEFKNNHQGVDGSKHATESRRQWIQLFAESVPKPHMVDLRNPEVVIHLRLFAVGGVSYIGVSVEREKARQKAPRDTERYHSLGSHGQPYYRAGINLNPPSHGGEPRGDGACVPDGACSGLDVWNLERQYSDRLKAAVAEVPALPVDSAACIRPDL